MKLNSLLYFGQVERTYADMDCLDKHKCWKMGHSVESVIWHKGTKNLSNGQVEVV